LEFEKDLSAFLENTEQSEHMRSEAFRNGWEERYFPPWNYNQVFGWMSIEHIGKDLRAFYFAHMKRWARLTKRKVFRYYGQIGLGPLPVGENSRDIWDALESELEHLKSWKLVKHRHVDDRSIRRLGPHVDWNSLLGR
jgi:hypothetical protein